MHKSLTITIVIMLASPTLASPGARILYDDISNTFDPEPQKFLSVSNSGQTRVSNDNRNNSKNRSGLADGTNPGNSTQNNGGTANPSVKNKK